MSTLLLFRYEAGTVIVITVTRHDIIVDRLLLYERLVVVPNVELLCAAAGGLAQLSRTSSAVRLEQVAWLRRKI